MANQKNIPSGVLSSLPKEKQKRFYDLFDNMNDRQQKYTILMITKSSYDSKKDIADQIGVSTRQCYKYDNSGTKKCVTLYREGQVASLHNELKQVAPQALNAIQELLQTDDERTRLKTLELYFDYYTKYLSNEQASNKINEIKIDLK